MVNEKAIDFSCKNILANTIKKKTKTKTKKTKTKNTEIYLNAAFFVFDYMYINK
jgi:hypothetical protein